MCTCVCACIPFLYVDIIAAHRNMHKRICTRSQQLSRPTVQMCTCACTPLFLSLSVYNGCAKPTLCKPWTNRKNIKCIYVYIYVWLWCIKYIHYVYENPTMIPMASTPCYQAMRSCAGPQHTRLWHNGRCLSWRMGDWRQVLRQTSHVEAHLQGRVVLCCMCISMHVSMYVNMHNMNISRKSCIRLESRSAVTPYSRALSKIFCIQ